MLVAGQESYLEARLFAYHNYLFTNPYDQSCWFIDSNGKVWKIDEDQISFKHQLEGNSKNSTFNPSMAFAANDILAITNGNKSLQVLHINSEENVKSLASLEIEAGIILDARYVQKKSLILIAICRIVKHEHKTQLEV